MVVTQDQLSQQTHFIFLANKILINYHTSEIRIEKEQLTRITVISKIFISWRIENYENISLMVTTVLSVGLYVLIKILVPTSWGIQ